MKAQDVLFWPGMAAEIIEMVNKCPEIVCLEIRPCQQSEPLKLKRDPTTALGQGWHGLLAQE